MSTQFPRMPKFVPSNVEFSYNEAIDDHLHSVKEALEANATHLLI